MSEISIYDDAIYRLLEEIYRINHREWKERVLRLALKHEYISYQQIKESLEEVHELLVRQCIQELVQGELFKGIKEKEQRDKRQGNRSGEIYYLNEDSICARIIMKELYGV